MSELRTDWKIFRQTMRDSTLKEALVDSFEYIKIRFHERRERFDERYGIETNGIVGLADIDGIGPHQAEASHYLPTRKQEFDRMMATVGEIDHQNHVFVDLGCGRGRVVLMAAEKPYKRVIGVDFSPTFIREAKENVARYIGPVATNEIELLAIDAVDFVVPPENLIVFLFSPFGPPVFDTVMQNLAASTRQRKQKITIVYYSPDYDDAVRAAGFNVVGQGKGDHWPWHVYSIGE